MSPDLALLICILFILFLLWLDRRDIEGVSAAVWIPQIWILISGSRSLSNWLGLHAPETGINVDLEGSPADRIVFLVLIFAGAMILKRRGLKWRDLFHRNRWMFLFFAFGAVSILWSDYPFVSFKRWFKAFGNVVMVLVILTEDRPYEAVGVVLRRFAVLFVPLSVLFIKYYPHLGRMYSPLGETMYTGVSDQKNGLGQICLVSGVCFLWSAIFNQPDNDEARRRRLLVLLVMLPMIAWLFLMADSATSMVCMIVAVVLFAAARHPAAAKDPRMALTLGAAGIVLFVALEWTVNLSATTIAMLGRRPDLTTRVPMWWDLLAMVKNPITGFGYESFWVGSRRLIVLERWGISGQAHNGYLQVYLDLGIIGLFILVGWCISGFRKSIHQLSVDYPTAILRICLLVVIVLYNWTEASFFGASLMWSLFIFGCMDVPEHQPRLEFEEDGIDAWWAVQGPDRGNH
jgi:exopolysaccharide production protein ExoQ